LAIKSDGTSFELELSKHKVLAGGEAAIKEEMAVVFLFGLAD
jgi:hypothetical protein